MATCAPQGGLSKFSLLVHSRSSSDRQPGPFKSVAGGRHVALVWHSQTHHIVPCFDSSRTCLNLMREDSSRPRLRGLRRALVDVSVIQRYVNSDIFSRSASNDKMGPRYAFKFPRRTRSPHPDLLSLSQTCSPPSSGSAKPANLPSTLRLTQRE